ncbi:hypothetical protein EDB92DRAFT_1940495 [Lactarius akahatsu]|uniref:CCHC-type domain-containing protein n=1 Tax=Lactarius akahatsu TaxID=416441 RepID=A0AAD4QCA2_9AGAM|nr:hypothetical protein EDB92DRAFT_1940495 [Lactarius akahatsu]
MPETMTEWQTAAHAEAQRACTIASSFGTQANHIKPDLYTQPFTALPTTSKSNDVVPMEVDAVTTSKCIFMTRLSDEEYDRCQKEGRCFQCLRIGHLTKECPERHKPRARINEVTTSPLNVLPNAQNIIQSALALRPEEREHILNTIALANMDYMGSPRAQINNIEITSRLPYEPRPNLLSLSDISPSSSYPPSPMSTHTPPCSGSSSPWLEPLTSHFLNSLLLGDEFPPLLGIFNPYVSTPALPTPADEEDKDVWYPAEEGIDSDWSQPTTSRPPVSVTDDTQSNGGVKLPISTSCHQLLFPRGALEQPRDPDMVQPTTPQPEEPVSMLQVEEEEPHCEAIVPRNHPLYAHIQKKRKSGNDADNEETHK